MQQSLMLGMTDAKRLILREWKSSLPTRDGRLTWYLVIYHVIQIERLTFLRTNKKIKKNQLFGTGISCLPNRGRGGWVTYPANFSWPLKMAAYPFKSLMTGPFWEWQCHLLNSVPTWRHEQWQETKENPVFTIMSDVNYNRTRILPWPLTLSITHAKKKNQSILLAHTPAFVCKERR